MVEAAVRNEGTKMPDAIPTTMLVMLLLGAARTFAVPLRDEARPARGDHGAGRSLNEGADGASAGASSPSSTERLDAILGAHRSAAMLEQAARKRKVGSSRTPPHTHHSSGRPPMRGRSYCALMTH